LHHQGGRSDSPADPFNPNSHKFNAATGLVFNGGDTLTVRIDDSPEGLRVIVSDVTSGEKGSMTASIANGFAQVLFEPSARTCTRQPYAFHPMYSTSTEHTRIPFAAHSFNVSLSGEIGHFEYCNAIDKHGNCISPGVDDPTLDADDVACSDTNGKPPFVPIIGCVADDVDFDGPTYKPTWAGTNPNASADAEFHPGPLLFSSPTFQSSGTAHDYDQVAFETILPVIER